MSLNNSQALVLLATLSSMNNPIFFEDVDHLEMVIMAASKID